MGVEHLLSRTGASLLIAGPSGVRDRKLVGQYSDSSRVSRLLQTPSRETKKLKPIQRVRETEACPEKIGEE